MKGVPVTALPHPLTLVSEGGAAVLYVWALALNACISTSYSLRKYAVMSQVRCKKKNTIGSLVFARVLQYIWKLIECNILYFRLPGIKWL